MDSIDHILDPFFSEKIQRETLDNGLTVIMKEDNSAEVASVQVWVKTGSIHEDEFLGSGISHYVEHMLFKGTKKRSYHQIAEDIQKVGGNVNAYTTFDRTVYYVDGPIEAAETAMDVLSDIAFNSSMDENEATRERDVILREIDMGLDDPDRQLSQAMFKNAFQTHPYQFPVIGHKNLFKQLTPSDLKDYYQRRYVPNNMVVVVVGAMPINTMREKIKLHFGSPQPKPIKNPLIQNERLQLSPRIIRKHGDFEIVRGGIAFKIPGLEHHDTPALGLLANVLGQGQSSFLYQKLREELALVHHISASIWNPASTGLFWIGYTCDNAKRLQVEDAIHQALKDFRLQKVPQAKLDKAIRQAMVGEINARKTMSGQASKLGLAEVVVGDLNYPKVFIKKLKKVSLDQLASIQDKYLNNHSFTKISLESKEEDSLSNLTTRQKSTLPDFQETKLDNNARIILQPYPNLPKVNIRIAFLGGPLYETPEQRGITGVLATLLTKDTKNRSALQVAESIENIGGYFSEFVGNNSFGLSIEVLPQDLPLASNLLQEAITNLNIQENAFQIEKDAQISAIREEIDDVASHGTRELRKLFFADHPYSLDCLGDIDTLNSLNLDHLKNCYHQLVNPDGMVVSISGDFNKEAILKEFDWVKNFQPKATKPSPALPFQGPQSTSSEKKLDREQVVVFHAYPGIGVKNTKEFEIAELLDEMMSGMTSRLFVKVREEQGMAYYVGASQMIGIDTGMFYLYSGTSQENYKKVLQEFDIEVQRIQNGDISDEELARCKTRLKAAQRMSLQTPASRASQASLDALYEQDINRWRTHADRIDAVTKDQIQTFAKQHFTPQNRVQLVVGNLE